ncbi:MAG: hypothetical protein U0L15_02030 [Oscillospiraceae bacterium]|nr:hypothetical protein [Oscillospiraceae bacterium]
MEQNLCPVDVISMCSAEGELRPLRLRMPNGEDAMQRIDIEAVVKDWEIPYAGVEAHVFRCLARSAGRELMLELKYTFRSHTWCLLRRIY